MRNRRKTNPEFAERQSASARRWQLANPMRHAWNQYRMNAKKKGISWDISQEEAYVYFMAGCNYCGFKPERPSINGIDRVDNNKGYTHGNLVPACATCNYAKNDMTMDAFKAWVSRVSFHMGVLNG